MTPTVYLLIGNIASGKSTTASNIMELDSNAVVLNDDSIYTMLGAYDYTRGFKAIGVLGQKYVVGALRNLASVLIGRGTSVIVDMPNLDPASRNLWWFGSGNANHVAVVHDQLDPAIHAHRRMMNDSRGYTFEVWWDIAKRMQSQYVPPGKEDQAWTVKHASMFAKYRSPGAPREYVAGFGGGSGSSSTSSSSGGSTPASTTKSPVDDPGFGDCPDCFGGSDY